MLSLAPSLLLHFMYYNSMCGEDLSDFPAFLETGALSEWLVCILLLLGASQKQRIKHNQNTCPFTPSVSSDFCLSVVYVHCRELKQRRKTRRSNSHLWYLQGERSFTFTIFCTSYTPANSIKRLYSYFFQELIFF